MNERRIEGRGHPSGEVSLPFYYTHSAARRYKISRIRELNAVILKLNEDRWEMPQDDMRRPLLNRIVSAVDDAIDSRNITSVVFSYENPDLIPILNSMARAVYAVGKSSPNLARTFEFAFGSLLEIQYGWEYPDYQLDVTLSGDTRRDEARADFVFRNTPKRIIPDAY